MKPQPISLSQYAVRCFPKQQQNEIQKRLRSNSDIKLLLKPEVRVKIYKTAFDSIKNAIRSIPHDQITKDWIIPTEADMIFISLDLDDILKVDRGAKIKGIKETLKYIREAMTNLNVVKSSHNIDEDTLNMQDRFALLANRSLYLTECANCLEKAYLQLQFEVN